MIVKPNVQELLSILNIGSRYTLVVATAKRARGLAQNNPDIEKAVSIAVAEMAEGKIIVHQPEKLQEDDLYAEYANGENT